VSGWTLTVRHGPRVERERFEALDDAVAALRERAKAVRAEGNLAAAQGFREYEPAERVNARLQLTTGGWLRGREAGIDVMGDGTFVPYTGGIRRRELEQADGESAFDAVCAALS
jgi:hypothetical protein